MSLLNDMLNDLEKNRAGKSEVFDEISKDPFDVPLAWIEEDESSVNYSKIFLLTLLMLLIAYVFYIKVVESKNKNISLETQYFSQKNNGNNEVAANSSGTAEFDTHSMEIKLTEFGQLLDGLDKKVNDIVYNSIDQVVNENAIKELASLPATAAGKENTLPEKVHVGAIKKSEIGESGIKKSEPENQQSIPRLYIAKSSQSQDLEAVTAAQSMISRRQFSQAEELLLNQIKNNPEAVLSVQVLADYYFDVKASEKLAELSTTTVFANKALRSYVLARRYALSGNTGLALSLLSEEVPQAEIEEKYLSLQAALYQQTGDYAKAQSLYERLIKKNSNSATLWLGYALACDANRNVSQALRAYEQVLRLPAENQTVTDYVKTRIQSLSVSNKDQG